MVKSELKDGMKVGLRSRKVCDVKKLKKEILLLLLARTYL